MSNCLCFCWESSGQEGTGGPRGSRGSRGGRDSKGGVLGWRRWGGGEVCWGASFCWWYSRFRQTWCSLLLIMQTPTNPNPFPQETTFDPFNPISSSHPLNTSCPKHNPPPAIIPSPLFLPTSLFLFIFPHAPCVHVALSPTAPSPKTATIEEWRLGSKEGNTSNQCLWLSNYKWEHKYGEKSE